MRVWTGLAALAAAIMAFGAASATAAQDWTMVAGTAEYVVGVDRGGMRSTGTRRAFTTIHAYGQTYDMGADSWIDYRISKYTADCSDRSSTLLIDTGYRLDVDTPVYEDVLGTETSTPGAGTVGGGIIDFVCGGEGHGSFANEFAFLDATRELLAED